jgi:phosphatidylserine decarboxylase
MDLVMDNAIRLYNPETRSIEEENIHAGRLMNFLYTTRLGAFFVFVLVKRKFFSRLYGLIQRRAGSRKKIGPFIKKHAIAVAELEKQPGAYPSFADFFTRKLKDGARPFSQDPKVLMSPCDGRLFSSVLNKNNLLPVKGVACTLAELLPREGNLSGFHGGQALVFRLAPMDTHRFCYIDEGVQEQVRTEPGCLHSVNPLSLQRGYRVYASNCRQYAKLETRNFGSLLCIEVGALTVGTIRQNKPQGGPFRKGEEMGWFEIGGSTIILIFMVGRVRIDDDINLHSEKGMETLVKQGMRIGAAL